MSAPGSDPHRHDRRRRLLLGCRIKQIFKFDDSLDAFGVHGVGGRSGALLVGIFAIRPVVGGFDQFKRQLVGLTIAALFAFVVSYVIALVIHKTIGLRVARNDEIEGLDITVHGESGYNLSEPIGISYDDSDETSPAGSAGIRSAHIKRWNNLRDATTTTAPPHPGRGRRHSCARQCALRPPCKL
jgi:hypothetical protein